MRRPRKYAHCAHHTRLRVCLFICIFCAKLVFSERPSELFYVYSILCYCLRQAFDRRARTAFLDVPHRKRRTGYRPTFIQPAILSSPFFFATRTMLHCSKPDRTRIEHCCRRRRRQACADSTSNPPRQLYLINR